MAGRVVVLEFSGEGREVLGLGAALVAVSWHDYPSVAAALQSKSAVVRGLRHFGFVGSDNCLTRGVGESFREREFWVVDSETGVDQEVRA